MSLKKEINKEEIECLIPHRKPFLLIDKLIDIVPMISATGVMNIKKSDFTKILLLFFFLRTFMQYR